MKKTILSALIPIFMATSAAFGGAVIAFNDNSGTANASAMASAAMNCRRWAEQRFS